MAKGWFEAQKPVVTENGIKKKAPRHMEAASRNKLSDTLNSPLISERQFLYKGATWYNPYFIDVGGKAYELKNIIFYKVDGTQLSNGKGWFGSNNYVDNFSIPRAVKRMKPKYDGATFIIPKKKEWIDRHDKYSHAVLYIPYDYFDFEVVEKEEKWSEGKRMLVTHHISRKFSEDQRGTPLTLREWEKAKVWEIPEAKETKEEIAELEKKLKAAKEKLEGL